LPPGRRFRHEDPVIKGLAVNYNADHSRVVDYQCRDSWQKIFAPKAHSGCAFPRYSASASSLYLKRLSQLPGLDPANMKGITPLDHTQFVCFQLDKYGTVLGWTPEQCGWERLKRFDVGAYLIPRTIGLDRLGTSPSADDLHVFA
jgi:hypothetical protein